MWKRSSRTPSTCPCSRPAACCVDDPLENPRNTTALTTRSSASSRHQARQTEDRYQNEAAASGRLWKCGNMFSKRGHRCVIYTQLAMLHKAHCLNDGISEPTTPPKSAPSAQAEDRLHPPSFGNPMTGAPGSVGTAVFVRTAFQLKPYTITFKPNMLPHCTLLLTRFLIAPAHSDFCPSSEGIVDECPLPVNIA